MKNCDGWYGDIKEKIEQRKKEEAERRRNLKKIAVVAACFVLVLGVAVAVPYGMNESEPTEPPILSSADETSNSEDAPDTYEVTDTSPVMTETGTVTETDPVVTEPDVTTSPEPAEPKYVTYKNEDGSYSWEEYKGPYAVGGTPDICPDGHYRGNFTGSDYHSIPNTLYAYVYNDPKFERIDSFWRERYYLRIYTVKYKCDGMTVKAFIDEHGITREEFDDNVDLVQGYAYNLDILFGTDAATADEYYLYRTVFERRQARVQNYNAVIRYIIDEYDLMGKKEDLGWIGYHDEGFMRYESPGLPEVVYFAGISKEELENIIETVEKKNNYTLRFNYDYSVIYNDDGTIKDELSALKKGNNSIEDIVRLSSTFGEQFCRVHEWEDAAAFDDTFQEDTADEWWRGTAYAKNYKCEGQCLTDLANEYLGNRSEGFEYAIWDRIKESVCPLKTLIDEYQVSKESLLEAVGDVDEWIDLDLIYNATAEEIMAHYGSFAHHSEHYKSMTHSTMFGFVIRNYTNIEGGYLKYDNPLPLAIQEANISREELEAIIEEVKKREEATQIYYGGQFCYYDYDLDVIYNEDGSYKELQDISSYELEKMFCRTGRYAE